MTALLPSLQAERARRSLVDYLSTTFALADAEPRRALAEFLEDPTDGIFKGPYMRLRLPFRPAGEGWLRHLDWRAAVRAVPAPGAGIRATDQQGPRTREAAAAADDRHDWHRVR